MARWIKIIQSIWSLDYSLQPSCLIKRRINSTLSAIKMPSRVYLLSWVEGAEKRERRRCFVLCVWCKFESTFCSNNAFGIHSKFTFSQRSQIYNLFSLASLPKWCVHSSELKPQALSSDNICLRWYIFHALNKQALWSLPLPTSPCQQTYLSPAGSKAYFFNYPPWNHQQNG